MLTILNHSLTYTTPLLIPSDFILWVQKLIPVGPFTTIITGFIPSDLLFDKPPHHTTTLQPSTETDLSSRKGTYTPDGNWWNRNGSLRSWFMTYLIKDLPTITTSSEYRWNLRFGSKMKVYNLSLPGDVGVEKSWVWMPIEIRSRMDG